MDVLLILNIRKFEMVKVTNRRRQIPRKPNTIGDYNQLMSGVEMIFSRELSYINVGKKKNFTLFNFQQFSTIHIYTKILFGSSASISWNLKTNHTCRNKPHPDRHS